MKIIVVACIAMACLLAGCGKSSHPLVGTWRHDGSAPVGHQDRTRAEIYASSEKLADQGLIDGSPSPFVMMTDSIRRHRALKAELQFRADGSVTQTVWEDEFTEPEVTHGTWEETEQMGFVYMIAIRWNGAAETENYEFAYHPEQEGVEDPTYIRLYEGQVGWVSEINFGLVPES